MVNYGYLANSDAIQSLTYKSGTTTRLTTNRSYDSSDRLDGVTNAYGTSQLQTYGVSEFDAMNRRKKITREDGTRWNYGYNDKGEVTSGIREKTAAPNTAIPGWSHGYSFDEIGNRLATTTNGRASTYTANNLNQITSRTIPRAFDVIGKAATTAAVTVNSQATTRLDEFFYKELPAGSGAVHVPYSVAATDATGTPTTRNGGKLLPATPENSIYDLDGNLTSDGRFTYRWDAENRLIAMQTLATVPVIAQRKLAFAYDAMGRRIRKTTWNGTATGTWLPQLDLRFIHELGGWNILAEITADSKFLRTYTWGPDLSGNRSGAGGVGGLLFTNLRASNKTFAHGMDLNGNVTLLVNTATGQAAATYDYGPFGEPLRQSGEYAKTNPYRFSTKYTDDETGLLDYGYRYYDPMLGRWLSRDPIAERGGLNLYGFVGNDGVDSWDRLGLAFDGPCKCKADKGNYKGISFTFSVKTLFDTYSVEDPGGQIVKLIKKKAQSAGMKAISDLEEAMKIAKSVTEGASNLAKVFNAAHEAQSGLLVEEASMEVGFQLCIESKGKLSWSNAVASGYSDIGASAIKALGQVQSGIKDTLIAAATDVAEQIDKAKK